MEMKKVWLEEENSSNISKFMYLLLQMICWKDLLWESYSNPWDQHKDVKTQVLDLKSFF